MYFQEVYWVGFFIRLDWFFGPGEGVKFRFDPQNSHLENSMTFVRLIRIGWNFLVMIVTLLLSKLDELK